MLETAADRVRRTDAHRAGARRVGAPRAGTLVAVALLALTNLTCAGERTPPPETDIVLIVVDTLRADRLASYGYDRETTPYLSSLAQTGALFERAYTASTWTASATASLLTSTFPSQHQVLTGYNVALGGAFDGFRPNRIPDELSTLAEMLRDSGYRTFGFADNLAGLRGSPGGSSRISLTYALFTLH